MLAEPPAEEEAEFFGTYAANYTDPETVWLERIIAATGQPLSPNVIAKAVLRAGYVRAGSVRCVCCRGRCTCGGQRVEVVPGV